MIHIEKIRKKIFSLVEENDKKIITLLGIRIRTKTSSYYEKLEIVTKTQDNYDLSALHRAKKAIIFIVPSKGQMAGGIMSIFNFCHYSRMVQKDCLCLIVTAPGDFTYARNETFENDELVYRWSQMRKNLTSVEDLIVHVPECLVNRFYKDLSKADMSFLKSVAKLKLNVLNQNINLMPDMKYIEKLYNLTSDVIHSTGFHKYTTQQVCNRFKLPLYYLPSFLNLDNCVWRGVEGKKKVVLYSNDHHPMKQQIIDRLRLELADFDFVEINNLSYAEFLALIADCLFTISFGEGFDGYYIQPYYAGSIGITVYNEEFFPEAAIADFPFVYGSYQELGEKVSEDIKDICEDKNKYSEVARHTHDYFVEHINKVNHTIEGLRNVYEERPTFLPK